MHLNCTLREIISANNRKFSDDTGTFLIEAITCSKGSEGHFGTLKNNFIFKATNLNEEEQESHSGMSACLAPMWPRLHSGTR